MATGTKTGPFYAVPAGSKSVVCRGSTCGRRIFFVRTANGRIVPVSCDVEGGKLPSETKDVGQLDMLAGGEAAVYEGRGQSHFLHCPDANEFTRGAR